jgi:dihydropteroate synthase
MPGSWKCRGLELPVFERVHVMGILNTTPDSFSDGGRFFDPDDAVKQGVDMASDGADIIDVGGESTRPGAAPVSAEEEMERVLPVIRSLAAEVGIPISIDTTKSLVAEAALEAGARIVNDVSALRFDPSLGEVVASSGAGLVLMHMLGEPRTMQENPMYEDVVDEVKQTLDERVAEAVSLGIAPETIAIDPGIGFGKTREHNLTLLKYLRGFTGDHPVVLGPSRKSFIGTTLDLPVGERLEGTAAAVAWAVAEGVQVVRVHDVKEIVRVVRMVEAIKSS